MSLINTSFIVSKLNAAQRQLKTSIRMYFNFEDEISVHTLASATRNILVDLCQAYGSEVDILREKLLKYLVKPEHHKDMIARFREAENFFKHADRDPGAQLTFNPATTEFVLLEAVEAYQTLTDQSIPEILLYRSWWILQHRECLLGASDEYWSIINSNYYPANERIKYFRDMIPLVESSHKLDIKKQKSLIPSVSKFNHSSAEGKIGT